MTHAKQSDFRWNSFCSEAEQNYKNQENISIAAYKQEMGLPLIGVASSVTWSGNYGNSRITALSDLKYPFNKSNDILSN